MLASLSATLLQKSKKMKNPLAFLIAASEFDPRYYICSKTRHQLPNFDLLLTRFYSASEGPEHVFCAFHHVPCIALFHILMVTINPD